MPSTSQRPGPKLIYKHTQAWPVQIEERLMKEEEWKNFEFVLDGSH